MRNASDNPPTSPRTEDDPVEIANYLIKRHGSREAALKAAIDGTYKAGNKGDFYSLSVWREIRKILSQETTKD